MTHHALPYWVRPLLLACGCLILGVAIALAAYFIAFVYWGSLPKVAQGLAVFFFPIPFALMQILAAKSFYYFEVFGKRLAIGYSGNRAFLERCIKDWQPFCLYLRNHSFEGGSVIWTSMISPDREALSRGTGLMHWPVANNVFESAVVESIGGHLPVFAIDSPSDLSVGMALRILVRDNDWYREVDRLIECAALIVINYEAQTPGILRELLAIRKHKREARTLLFTTEAALAALVDFKPELVRGLKWVQLKEGDERHKRLEQPKVPESLVEFALAIRKVQEGSSAADRDD